MSGGAIGYVAYDCVKYFEPRTARPLKDVLKTPESVFMFYDTIVAFDHFFQAIKVITYLHLPEGPLSEAAFRTLYDSAQTTLAAVCDTLQSGDIPLPPQPPIVKDQKYVSNIGQSGYEGHVKTLKQHIIKGDIIQAVPSQRFSRPTSLHPFNIYRHLRTVNPSPYLFYLDCTDFQLVGASPELLVKSENGRIITHPIAGTVKRGKTPEEDDALALQLVASLKDRAEHVMLVDLARNDVNRVCDPLTTTVDRLMTVERFSHVMHLVSQVSGVLRPGMTRFDALRSIFPAGTVSGAPKIRAMELIAELEGERRGVYGGAVGYWGYEEESMDTCIALRTMLVKDGIAYLQAGKCIRSVCVRCICVDAADRRRNCPRLGSVRRVGRDDEQAGREYALYYQRGGEVREFAGGLVAGFAAAGGVIDTKREKEILRVYIARSGCQMNIGGSIPDTEYQIS